MKSNNISGGQSIRTFLLDLGGGVRCSARINLENINAVSSEKLPSLLTVEWEGSIKTSHFEKYRVWMGSVWQTVATAANKSIVAFMSAPGGELLSVVCEPNQVPEFKYCALQ
jgi:hypothetical protein